MSGGASRASDKVNTYGIVLIGVVAAILLWVSVIALQAYYQNTEGALEAERDAANKGREVRDLKAAQLATLQETKVVDPKKGIVTLPIEDAMRLVVRDARGGAPALVPAVGPDDKPTVPAAWGHPPDNAKVPGAPGAAGAAAPGAAGAAAPGAAGAAAPGAAPAGATAAPGGGQAAPATGTAPATPTH